MRDLDEVSSDLARMMLNILFQLSCKPLSDSSKFSLFLTVKIKKINP